MSQIIKPRNPVINWGNPLTKGLVFDVPFFEGGGVQSQDIISKVYGGSSGTWSKDKLGITSKWAGGQHIGWPAGFLLSTQVFSIVALINPTDISAGGHAIFAPSVNGGIYFRLNGANLDLVKASLVDLGSSTGTVTANVWSVVAVTYNANGNFIFYNNGVNIGSGTNVQTFTAAVPAIAYSQAADFFVGQISVVHFWNRVLSPQEIKTLADKPFQIYQQPKVAYGNLPDPFKWQPLTENLQPNHHLMRWEVVEY